MLKNIYSKAKQGLPEALGAMPKGTPSHETFAGYGII